VQGQLGEKLIADLIREIANKGGSGLLRFSHGKTIKAIFFDKGAPVYAISNLSTDQLEYRLAKEELVTPSQVEEARQSAGKAHQLGPVLVQMGAIDQDLMVKMVRSQVLDIVLSLFEWKEGDYLFDERIRATHEVTLGLSSADIILEGARHAADFEEMAEAIAPQDAVVVRIRSNGSNPDMGNLIPVESYVLSRIESPTPVSEVGPLNGIPDQDAHRALCALISAGFLKLLDDKEKEETQQADDSLARLREDVSRKLHFFGSADHYEVLGVTRQATTGDIKAAYYQLAKKYHPDRYRQPEHAELRGKLEALFGKISQAYETLKDPGQRTVYDERLRQPSGALAAKDNLATTPLVLPADRKSTGELLQQAANLKTSTAPPQTADEPVTQEAQTIRAAGSGTQSAEHYYQQGRARYDRKEYHAAVHLLREAVKLEPGKPQYHFHLGVALLINPRTRREAEQHLAKAVELDPYNPQIRVKLGTLYKEAGLQKKAEQYFREALNLDPDNKAAQREVGGAQKKAPLGNIFKADLGTLAKRLFKK
jgi:curved DNA-binding protein CbpA